MRGTPEGSPRHDWTQEEAEGLLRLPFADLLFRAQRTHRRHFDPNAVQLSTLMNIKAGGCPEDCAYCPQSARYDTGVEPTGLAEPEAVVAAARRARAAGATRFCMGAAWRAPKDRDLARVAELVRAVKALGLETCATLGMLSRSQAQVLKEAGLDYYNHNIDTSPGFYGRVISTRRFEERLETLRHVREAGIKVCCGGIVGMGEGLADRAALLVSLANLPVHPESVPINLLVRVPGTPLAATPRLDPFELVRTVAAARIMMPKSVIRLSAGRLELAEPWQALCFVAGANSIFYGERLLTAANPDTESDRAMLAKLGMRALP